MKVLGLDLETTGLNNNSDLITEIGAVLYDVEAKKPLEIMNRLVYTDSKISKKVEDLTGINEEMIKSHGLPLIKVIDEFNTLVDKAEYLIIHNATFDLGFLKKLEPAGIKGLDKPVIDTMRDLPINKTIHQSVKLTHLAATHGFLNPFSHRAIFDVLTMLKILSCYDFNEVVEYAKSPVITVVAQVSFDERDKAKSQGFKWDSKKKIWYKKIKEVDFNKNLPFGHTIVQEGP